MIERNHMFMDWQSSHSHTDNTDKSYLHSQCYPGQNSNDIHHRTRGKKATHLGTQKTTDNITYTEKKNSEIYHIT